MEKDGDLEDIFKYELAEKKAKTKAISQLGRIAKDFGFDSGPDGEKPPVKKEDQDVSNSDDNEENDTDRETKTEEGSTPKEPVIESIPKIKTGKDKFKNLVVSLILLVTMSIHGFFEGMALGVTQNKTATWNIFMAIILHKWAAAISLTLSCINKGLGFFPSLICLLCFASASPVGVFFGYLLSNMNPVVSQINSTDSDLSRLEPR